MKLPVGNGPWRTYGSVTNIYQWGSYRTGRVYRRHILLGDGVAAGKWALAGVWERHDPEEVTIPIHRQVPLSLNQGTQSLAGYSAPGFNGHEAAG